MIRSSLVSVFASFFLAVSLTAAFPTTSWSAAESNARSKEARPDVSLTLDESPATISEWGYRPANNTTSQVNPPSFSWRPQNDIVRWRLQCARGKSFKPDEPERIVYSADAIQWNVHCPPRTLPPGKYVWRYRGFDKNNRATNWSRPRRFTVAKDAATTPMPPRDQLLARIPKAHPRLFLRPEDVPRLKKLAAGPMKDQYASLVAQSERLLADPPPTVEPKKYPPGMVRKSEDWRELWWGNRTYTIAALRGASTLGFTRLLGGRQEYGQLAKRILLDCAKWDPHGATGYRYNDEAGMPYAYYFARTYTFVHDLLNDQERKLCQEVMKQRGEEMYRHLCPGHFWRPYSSHSNRAWHFLGEIGIAFHGEIEGADDWVVFATSVFFNTYPVWSDDDGGWHEGVAYWNSYINRFTWWADVMQSALKIDAFQKPYFARAGYYPLYLMPPGKVGGGFGDLTAKESSKSVVGLMSRLASRTGNPYWQWYAVQNGGPRVEGGYVGFLRQASLSKPVKPKAPTDLPTSRYFRGIGQAYLNTTLENDRDNVQVVFKSSSFGAQSHGYEANNAFLLGAYGQRLLIRSGRRDMYGSAHHTKWMWSPRSLNNITIDSQRLAPHSSWAAGKITEFQTTPTLDLVVGEAADSYRKSEDAPSLLERYTRSILFVKPELVIVFDRLVAREPSRFQYWLHAVNRFDIADQRHIRLNVQDVACDISFLAPKNLDFRQTDQYDPNPRKRIKLREWHLTAEATAEKKSLEFITLYRPHRSKENVPLDAQLVRDDHGYRLSAPLTDGQVVALLPIDDGALSVERLDRSGATVELLSTD